MRRPVNSPYRITLGFRATSSPYSPSNPHNGVDYVSDDRRIVSAHAGKVTFAGWANDRSGNMVAVEGGGYRITYSHIKADGFKVSVGQNVSEGTYLADMGATGFVTGVHVHVVVNGGTQYVEKLITNQGEDMIRDVDNEFGRWVKLGYQIRGRNLTRTEFRNSAVGLSWLRAMEILSDDPESDLNASNAELGRRARAGNWESQIKSLNDAIKIKDNEITRLQSELALISNDTENLNKFGEMLRWFVSRIGLNR